jgi:F0F1-type ATP synthase epsilon subunit
MDVKVFSKEGILYQEEKVESVILPGEEGKLGILPGHTYLVCLLKKDKLRIKKANSLKSFELKDKSLAEVLPNKVNIYIFNKM